MGLSEWMEVAVDLTMGKVGGGGGKGGQGGSRVGDRRGDSEF